MTTEQIILLSLIGIVAGIVSGLMGVGGAIIIVPALVMIMGLSQHHAQGTSLTVLLLPVGIFAVINYAKQGFVNYKFAFVLIVAFVIGSYFGSLFSVKLPENTLKKIFGVLLLLVSIKYLLGK
jgi:uncharacterized membrane protein YfcA